MFEETISHPCEEIKVSFGYQCNRKLSDSLDIPNGGGGGGGGGGKLRRTSSSFSCLSGAALSANATLANTNMCHGFIGAEILPNLDSPKSFRRIPSSPSLSKLDQLSSSLHSNMSYPSCPSTPSDLTECDSYLITSMSAPSRSEGFLNAVEVEVAGGAAGEDRVQAVCSEENGWLFCGIYDGFNGRDAADYLAGTFYDTISFNLNILGSELKLDAVEVSECLDMENTVDNTYKTCSLTHIVLDSLQRALVQAENDFLHMVEQEMEDRPDLVSIGSCVLVVLLHGKNLYTLNLGDSRAVLATYADGIGGKGQVTNNLRAVQLTESHTLDNEIERNRLLGEHPDDPATIVNGKVKGKLKVTRAFGVGYLKKKKLNDALIGILRVRNLLSPPYVSNDPYMSVQRICNLDNFVIVGSDGLFDFFSNEEAVELVDLYISENPSGDPSKYLLEKLVERAAYCAGFSAEELLSIPAGYRRNYHDDVTVIVIILGQHKRTTKASTCL